MGVAEESVESIAVPLGDGLRDFAGRQRRFCAVNTGHVIPAKKHRRSVQVVDGISAGAGLVAKKIGVENCHQITWVSYAAFRSNASKLAESQFRPAENGAARI